MKRKQGRQSGPHRSEDQLTLKDDDRSDRSTIDLTYGEPFEFTFHTYHGVVRFSLDFDSEIGTIASEKETQLVAIAEQLNRCRLFRSEELGQLGSHVVNTETTPHRREPFHHHNWAPSH